MKTYIINSSDTSQPCDTFIFCKTKSQQKIKEPQYKINSSKIMYPLSKKLTQKCNKITQTTFIILKLKFIQLCQIHH
jgi:hypothetical protein